MSPAWITRVSSTSTQPYWMSRPGKFAGRSDDAGIRGIPMLSRNAAIFLTSGLVNMESGAVVRGKALGFGRGFGGGRRFFRGRVLALRAPLRLAHHPFALHLFSLPLGH